ncbi:MAG: hypothetical protein B7Y90_19085 [Alphaproteobacteria bacterium 32-64-14]|nr:MAG: hypothetical protein B7Y90_19085 [Alphaproteobacteria bacterium 32-64-14]
MKKPHLLSLPSAAATVLLGLALAAPPALAQEAEREETGQESEAADAEEGEDEDVVVRLKFGAE